MSDNVIEVNFGSVDRESGFPEVIRSTSVSTDYAGIGGHFVFWPEDNPDDAGAGLIIHKGDWTALYVREGDFLYYDASHPRKATFAEVILLLFARFGRACFKGHWFGIEFYSTPYDPVLGRVDCPAEIDEAIAAIERMARDGRGPTFTQAHVATHGAFYGIGTTTEDFCAAIVALEKTTRKV